MLMLLMMMMLMMMVVTGTVFLFFSRFFSNANAKERQYTTRNIYKIVLLLANS